VEEINMEKKKIITLIASVGLVMIGAVGGVLISNLEGEEKVDKEIVIEESIEKEEVNKKENNDDVVEDENIEENKDTSIEIDKEISADENKLSEESKESLKVEYLNKLNECNEKVQKIRNDSSVDENNMVTPVMMGYAGKEFEVWDIELNIIWKELENYMGVNEFEVLRQEQIGWLNDNTNWEEDLFEKEGVQTYQRLQVMSYKTERTKDRCFELVNKYM
jgi:uncharacterized protein YecT (DUF1311 family)